jgi:hypothetical protein
LSEGNKRKKESREGEEKGMEREILRERKRVRERRIMKG